MKKSINNLNVIYKYFFNIYIFLINRDTNVIETKVAEYQTLIKLSSIYYAFNTIDSYLKEPFTSSAPLTLFNTSRFVANAIGNNPPPKGISMLYPFF